MINSRIKIRNTMKLSEKVLGIIVKIKQCRNYLFVRGFLGLGGEES